MPATYYARMTAAGLAAVAAAYDAGELVGLMEVAVGDGGGANYDPTGAETALVNELARITISNLERVIGEPTHLRISAVIPASTGGFWVREAGVFDADGTLFAIIKHPPFYKPTVADGGGMDLLLNLVVVVNADVDVTIIQEDGATFASQDWARSNRDFYALVDKVTAPPVSPLLGAQYLINVGATGDFAGGDDRIAIWRGDELGWQIFAVKPGCTVLVASTSLYWRYTGSVWRQIMASEAEHVAGSSTSLFSNPAGVVAMLKAFAKDHRAQRHYLAG
jgi:hypothetical protein